MCVAPGMALRSKHLNGQASKPDGSGARDCGRGFGMGNNPNRTRWFAGKIDNVQMYNGALSAAEILTLYRSQAGSPRHLPEVWALQCCL
jgi:hypothetical protein